MALKRLRDIIIGTPLPTKEYGHMQLDNIRALAAFSPDALSSIAYANQEIFLTLVVAGAAGLSMSFPIGLAIVVILLMVTLSYLQTLNAYPSGGGSWIVARENLGIYPGLIAAAALLIDYLLTAAISLTAGVAAIASAFPVLWPYRVVLALFILVVITIINLRGVPEAGTTISFPVYFFIFTYIPMLAYGIIVAIVEGPGNLVEVAPPPIEQLSLILLLNAFSSGCTALTGIEAISNGVPAFRDPKPVNASKAMIAMAGLMVIFFLGSIWLTQYLAIIPGPEETILSALARRILGNTPLYLIIQTSTLLVLSVAANTSFADFPRVTALLAQDSYIARQLSNLGDRLVYSNGMLLLAGASGALILIFNGDTHSLVPLFAVGAFLAFTLSQLGMVVHWWRYRGSYWILKLFINGIGAITTASALIVIGISKFLDGAWITFILIPSLVYVFLRIKKHYNQFDIQMSPRITPSRLPKSYPENLERAAVPVARVNTGTIDAVSFAKLIAKEVMAVHVALDESKVKKIKKDWGRIFPAVPLYIVPSPYRSVTEPLQIFLEDQDKLYNDGQLTAIVLPEFVTAKWWQTPLHNQTSIQIRRSIINKNRETGQNRIIIEVPYLLTNEN